MPLPDHLCDHDAEARLLGVLMRRPKVWDEVADKFRPELFDEPFHRHVAEVVRETAKPGSGFPLSRVMRELRGIDKLAAKKIADMGDEVITMEECVPLVDMLSDLASRRAILECMRGGAKLLEDLETPLEDVMGQIQAGMLESAHTLGHDGGRTWDEVLAANYTEMIARRDGKTESAWPVGLAELGEALKGIRRKHLIILAARPSMGKTTFAQFWAVQLAKRGVHSYVFCPDQAAEEITERELWNISGIDGVTWEQADRWSDNQFEVAKDAFSKAMGMPIKLNDRRGMTPEEIYAIARREKAGNPKLGLIVIDHLTALRMRGDRRMNWAKIVGEAANLFKTMSEELDVAVLLLAQLNRGLESRDDKRPTMSDLRDSGEIEEHANEILFLYREEYYKPDKQGARNVCEINVAKQKQGPRAGTAFVKFEPQYARFSDLSIQELNAYVNVIEADRSRKSNRKTGGAA